MQKKGWAGGVAFLQRDKCHFNLTTFLPKRCPHAACAPPPPRCETRDACACPGTPRSLRRKEGRTVETLLCVLPSFPPSFLLLPLPTVRPRATPAASRQARPPTTKNKNTGAHARVRACVCERSAAVRPGGQYSPLAARHVALARRSRRYENLRQYVLQ